jgi:hypothetical protein
VNGGAITSFVVAALAGSAVAAPPDRTAVFIASGAGTDDALADNLTEVVIAKLAERAPGEHVGTHELRRWLERSGGTGPVPACISRAPCLRGLGAALGVRNLISGSVLADHGQFTIALTLVEVDTGVVEATATKTVGGELEQVIRGVQDTVVELLRPKLSPNIDLAIQSPPSTDVALSIDRAPAAAGTTTRARGWRFYAGLGTAAAAVLSLSAAGVFGVFAYEKPTGATRAEAQRDLSLRDSYASAANTLWIVGGVLGVASVAIFAWPQPRNPGP